MGSVPWVSRVSCVQTPAGSPGEGPSSELPGAISSGRGTTEPAAGPRGLRRHVLVPADGAPARTLTQAAALLTGRLCRARRAWRATLSSLLLPVFFVALAMGLFMVRPLAVDYPPLELTPGQYGKAETSFFR